MTIQVNVTTKVNNKSIRKETHNNREHWVLSSYTLPANVIMNGGLYTSEQIDRHYRGIEGTLAPLGHPVLDGQFISAFSAEGINEGHVGAWNRNVKKSGNRVHVEKWIDIEVANQSEKGRELIERIEAIERGDDVPPIHTSIAVFLEQLEPSEQQKAMGAEWVADIKSVDHDAILLHEVGAATPEQGVGMMVNADAATPMQANSGALIGESFRELERRLEKAAREKFAPGGDQYAWVADFTDSQAVVIADGGTAKVYGYKSDSGKIVFEDTGTPVQREESWVAVVANKVKSIFKPQDNLAANKKEGDMPLTTEEKQELFGEVGKAVAANVAEALKPITEKVDTLQSNQEKQFEALTANSRKEEADKREVIAKTYGEVVANSLQGEALDEMFKKCGTASPLGANAANTPPQTGAPAADEYFAK
ncbi:hypothetical protein [Vibrio casei]|uniref:DUF2213 domain-containing protein n=1 Tax=Vibrio casei TaxID=673372 RepID=A0A368LHH1_9VIBR|nr:hypothetical protein [Vibrio casei]RCS70167.1 hypothetical protein CIK83_11935 [Vibrio casei]SJN24391.1 gp7 [Vibrio casei]